MFTGVVDEDGQTIVKALGGEMVDSLHECTHLVTDQVRRTVKFLCGLARGIMIVVPNWLQQCKAAGKFIDGTPYLVHDVANEKKFDFTLVRSIETASEHRLLTDYKIHVTKSVKPEPVQMKDIIQCAGGEFLVTMPKKKDEKIVVVTCEEDRALCKAAMSAGISLVTSEFILTGILRQRIEIESFLLSSLDAVSSKGTADAAASRGTKRRTLEPAPTVGKTKKR